MSSTIEKAVLFSALEPFFNFRDDYDRVYFGHEFCQRKMPGVGDLDKAMNWAEKRGLAFSLVTSFVTDAGLDRIQALVERLVPRKKTLQAEVVVNDFGALRWIHKTFPEMPIALGRLLTKQKRGPRILQIAQRLPEAAMDHFKRSNVDLPHLTEFLKTMSVARVELDNLLQGITRTNALPASLYHPFAYISTTRLCLLMKGDRPDKNPRSIGICSRECKVYDVTLTHHNMPVPLRLKGNTYFFKNESLPTNLAEIGVNRLVLVPELT